MKRYRLLRNATFIYDDKSEIANSLSSSPRQMLTSNDCFVILESYGGYIHRILAAGKTVWVYIKPVTLLASEIVES